MMWLTIGSGVLATMTAVPTPQTQPTCYGALTLPAAYVRALETWRPQAGEPAAHVHPIYAVRPDVPSDDRPVRVVIPLPSDRCSMPTEPPTWQTTKRQTWWPKLLEDRWPIETWVPALPRKRGDSQTLFSGGNRFLLPPASTPDTHAPGASLPGADTPNTRMPGPGAGTPDTRPSGASTPGASPQGVGTPGEGTPHPAPGASTPNEADRRTPQPAPAGDPAPTKKPPAQKPPARAKGDLAAAAALGRLGTPFSWGGGRPSGPTTGIGRGANTVGFDCSGLTLYAWSKAGISLGHYTGTQFRQGRRVPLSDLRKGDLVFFGGGSGDPTHVGLYLGGGIMIHAPKTGDVVKKTQFLDSSYYRPIYRGAIRPA